MKKVLLIIIATVVLVTAVLIINLGMTETKVSVLDNSVKIEGVYGVTVDFSEIAGITMIEYSMEEIGIGDSKGSLSAANGVLKGRFKSPRLGEVLLFVSSQTSPTLMIERVDDIDIFISFSDGIKTEHLYREIKASLP